MKFFTEKRKCPHWLIIALQSGGFLSVLLTDGAFRWAWAGLYAVNMIFTFLCCTRPFAALSDALRAGNWPRVGYELRWHTQAAPTWLLITLIVGAAGGTYWSLLVLAVMALPAYALRERKQG